MLFKEDCEKEDYLNMYINRYKRSLLCQIRFGILPIMVECGRFQYKKDELTGNLRKMNYNERVCPLCSSDEVEDEFHFVMRCDKYIIPRNVLFQTLSTVNNEFNNMNELEKFIFLFKTQSKLLSNYVADAWHIFKEVLFKKV